MSSDDIAFVSVAMLVAAALLLRPLVRALARRMEGGAAGADMTRDVNDLRQRVAELEGDHGHLLELEERVDFAERLLAQRGEAVQLPVPRTPL